MIKKNRQLAIIGIGPEGGFALEHIVLELVKTGSFENIHFLLFEASGGFRNGAIWDVNQVETNWLHMY